MSVVASDLPYLRLQSVGTLTLRELKLGAGFRMWFHRTLISDPRSTETESGEI